MLANVEGLMDIIVVSPQRQTGKIVETELKSLQVYFIFTLMHNARDFVIITFEFLLLLKQDTTGK